MVMCLATDVRGAGQALAGRHPPGRQRVRLNQLVHDVLSAVASPLRADGIHLTMEAALDLPEIWADPRQLEQLLLHLVTDAHQAMRQSAAPTRRLRVATRTPYGGLGVRLEVADSRRGIPAALPPRIVEPFLPTKSAGAETDLGLSRCAGIVAAHGGVLDVESPGGQGVTFVVRLPLGLPVDGPAPPEHAAGDTRVAMGDDEPEAAAAVARARAGARPEDERAGPTGRARDRTVTDVARPVLEGSAR
jgi:signal transduction histidine kinase